MDGNSTHNKYVETAQTKLSMEIMSTLFFD